MRFAIVLLVVTLVSPPDKSLTGVVLLENEPLSGANVEILETGVNQVTDHAGRFRLTVHDLDNVTLKVSSFALFTCKVEIQSIKLKSDEMNLGKIPIFYNEMINAAEFEKLPEGKRMAYEGVYHWAQLLGYIHKNKVDKIAIQTALREKQQVKYLIDSTDNKVIINYEDWSKRTTNK